MYDRLGFAMPWTGFIASLDGVAIGSCGFKGPPKDGMVEIAYVCLPPWEGNGYGTEMCRLITCVAQETDASIQVTAQTLETNLASQRILEKNGFMHTGSFEHEDDGPIMEWTFKPEDP